MIFLSHQNNDKEFVDVIAYELKEMYGEHNVFYDKWSIKPGENILESMSSGIEKCKYFFYFITENSLQSEMVGLEWTAAISKKSKQDIEFIPIRADNVNPPAIISALKYLDLYTNGLETTLLQMKEIITKENISETHPTFNNVVAYLHFINEKEVHFYITAKRFFEPGGAFIIFSDLNEDEAKLTCESSSMTYEKFLPNAIPEQQLNGFYIDSTKDIRKGFYIKLVFKTHLEGSFDCKILHVIGENKGKPIELVQIKNVEELPRI